MKKCGLLLFMASLLFAGCGDGGSKTIIERDGNGVAESGGKMDVANFAENNEDPNLVEKRKIEDGRLLYKNKELGFSFVFPVSWEGYEMKKVQEENGNLYFMCTLNNEKLFQVMVYSKLEWERRAEKEGINENEVEFLWKGKAYVLNGVIFSELSDNRKKEARESLETFRFDWGG